MKDIKFIENVDKKFLTSIKDYKEMYFLPTKTNHYYTLLYKNKKAAICGTATEFNIKLFQIAIHQKYRGKDLLKICADFIMSKYNLKILYSTINEKHISSIKAHIKAGFKRIPKKIEDALKQAKKLESDQIRMSKIK